MPPTSSTRRSVPPSRSDSPTWAPGSSTASAGTWRRPANWGATVWKKSWDKAAWARCGAPGIACWLVLPQSSSFGRPLTGDARPGVSDDAVRRFEREAQAIARLRSPHTVELFDFGVADDGAFYYVMELLDGLDADTLVRRSGPVPAERAVHLLRQVCHSLSEAESCGLVHRDIKPANIFVCRYGEEYDFVKVLDFGIVTAPERWARRPEPALTLENVVQGTPAFIAPEQALGESRLTGVPISMRPAASHTGF